MRCTLAKVQAKVRCTLAKVRLRGVPSFSTCPRDAPQGPPNIVFDGHGSRLASILDHFGPKMVPKIAPSCEKTYPLPTKVLCFANNFQVALHAHTTLRTHTNTYQNRVHGPRQDHTTLRKQMRNNCAFSRQGHPITQRKAKPQHTDNIFTRSNQNGTENGSQLRKDLPLANKSLMLCQQLSGGTPCPHNP